VTQMEPGMRKEAGERKERICLKMEVIVKDC
jgi:hypothetical protein